MSLVSGLAMKEKGLIEVLASLDQGTKRDPWSEKDTKTLFIEKMKELAMELHQGPSQNEGGKLRASNSRGIVHSPTTNIPRSSPTVHMVKEEVTQLETLADRSNTPTPTKGIRDGLSERDPLEITSKKKRQSPRTRSSTKKQVQV
jgi:hypothetical protein